MSVSSDTDLRVRTGTIVTNAQQTHYTVEQHTAAHNDDDAFTACVNSHDVCTVLPDVQTVNVSVKSTSVVIDAAIDGADREIVAAFKYASDLLKQRATAAGTAASTEIDETIASLTPTQMLILGINADDLKSRATSAREAAVKSEYNRLADLCAPIIRKSFANIMRTVQNAPANGSEKSGKREPKDQASIFTSDGVQYTKKTVTDLDTLDGIAVTDGCQTRGCRFCDIAETSSGSYAAHKMLLTKCITDNTSEYVESHRRCLQAAQQRGLIDHPAAVSYVDYVQA
jgi:hypothetical protein